MGLVVKGLGSGEEKGHEMEPGVYIWVYRARHLYP